jgi:hypothetical protein
MPVDQPTPEHYRQEAVSLEKQQRSSEIRVSHSSFCQSRISTTPQPLPWRISFVVVGDHAAAQARRKKLPMEAATRTEPQGTCGFRPKRRFELRVSRMYQTRQP